MRVYIAPRVGPCYYARTVRLIALHQPLHLGDAVAEGVTPTVYIS